MPRIAVLSTAHVHSRAFLKRLAECDSAYAVWDDMPERGRAEAEAVGARFVAELDELLGDDAVDGFVICSENTRHLPLLERALPLGKPVMCEKPLATTDDDARSIARLVAEHGTPLSTGYFQPFGGSMQAVAALLDADGLGRLTHVSHRNAHHAAYGRWFDDAAKAWFTDPELAGGGALMDMGAHSVHLLRRLCGPVSEVFAELGNRSGIYESVDDYGCILLRFANGGRNGLECFGSEAALWQDGERIMLGRPQSEPETLAPAAPLPDRIDRLLALLAGELAEAEWRADLAAGLDEVAIMAAAYRAAASGRWEPVAELQPVASK